MEHGEVQQTCTDINIRSIQSEEAEFAAPKMTHIFLIHGEITHIINISSNDEFCVIWFILEGSNSASAPNI